MNKVGFSILSCVSFLCLSLLSPPSRAEVAESISPATVTKADQATTPSAATSATPSAIPSATPATTAPTERDAAAANVVNKLTFEEAYKNGVQFFQAKEYEKARDAFAKALEKDPQNPSAMTNLALAQFKLNQKGWAIALLRKSLEIDPEQLTAQAGLKFAQSQLEIKEIPHEIETYESVRSQFLQPVTLNIYLILTALFLFATGWTFLDYIGKRRKALQEEESLPAFPVISLILAIGLFLTLSLAGLKVYDLSLTRGTIVDEKVSVQAAPGENQVALFDLHAGFEVLVRNVDKDWVQVTYPGASTGWIKKSALLITSGKDL